MRIARRRAYSHRVKVLVVDDVARVRVRLAAMLVEIPGVTAVFEADAIATAIHALCARAPDVVVLDLHLGEESGLTLAGLLKRERPALIVVMMTNEPTEPVRRQCRALGVEHFFDKSKDFEDVLRIVAGAVGPTRAPETSDT
jgi:two-component system OmpR family response regulator